MNAKKLPTLTSTAVTPQNQPPRLKRGKVVASAALALLIGGTYHAAAWDVYFDNFDDGNDTQPAPAWVHYDPIHSTFASVGAGALYAANTYGFPSDGSGGKAYELSAAADPYANGGAPLPPPYNQQAWGPGRTFAYRPDVYTNFNVTADLLPGWAGGGGVNGSYVQAMGLIARLNHVAIGQANGYAFLYLNCDESKPTPFLHNALTIVRVTGENEYGLPGSGNGGPGETDWRNITLDNSQAYRFQFIGKGTHLEGRVYSLSDTNTPIAILDADTAGQPAVYQSGMCGIIGANVNDGAGNYQTGPVDMTWDNYNASVHSPYEIRDNFDRGNDGVQTAPPWAAPAWVHYDPLGGLTAPQSSFSFPGGNTYRIYSPVPLAPDAGTARAASVRQEVSYSDFYASVDVVNWDTTQRVAFGMLARTDNIGLGSTTGYLHSWDQGSGLLPNATGGTIDINRIDNEQPRDLGTTYTHMITGHKYRMEYIGKGSDLTGRIYDLSNPAAPQAVVTANDSTYASGNIALFSGSQGSDGSNPTVSGDVTFDNFYSDTAEPRLAISKDGSGNAVLSWPANLASIWTLQTGSSTSPGATWTTISGNAAQAITYSPSTGLNTYTASLSAGATTYFRLHRLDPLAYP